MQLCLCKTHFGEYRYNRNVVHFQNLFRPHQNAEPAFSNSSIRKAFLKKLRFGDGLMWTEDVTGEINCVFKFIRCSVDGAKTTLGYPLFRKKQKKTEQILTHLKLSGLRGVHCQDKMSFPSNLRASPGCRSVLTEN